jgi:hypothetical protein
VWHDFFHLELAVSIIYKRRAQSPSLLPGTRHMTADPADQTEPNEIGAVKERLADLGKLVHSSTHLPAGVHRALIRSLDDLGSALAKAEKASLTDRERIVLAAEATTRLAVQRQPDKPLIERSLKSLADAAHALRNREPMVVEAVSRIAMALTDIGI